MKPEYKAAWDQFKARVSDVADDASWSSSQREWGAIMAKRDPDYEPMFVTEWKVDVVVEGVTHTWCLDEPDEDAEVDAAENLERWLAGIEWKVRRIASGLPTIEVGGHCPVQGEEIRDGWLFYFRARGGWSLSAWPPGTWRDPGEGAEAGRALDMVDDFLRPPIEVDESDEDESFPGGPEHGGYPGWWSHEYAAEVAEWAIAKAKTKTRTET